MSSERKKLGEILVEQRLLSARSVERLLPRALQHNKKLGMVLEELGLITGEELTNALAVQFGYKVVKNLVQYRFPPELLGLMSADVAMQHLIFPLKTGNGWLALAMADPTNQRLIENLSANTGLKIAPYLATRQDVYNAVCHHYLGRPPGAVNRRTVLVVEDDKLILDHVQKILVKHGYRVVVAHDGLEAFKQVIAEKPQVVLTDKEMPKMNGYGLLAAMRNMPEFRTVPVILHTARISEEEEASAFDKGFFDFITKPVRELSLLTRIKRAFQYYESQFRP
ncbi:MAG TPA: response regulator [Geobacteraceae bacterium]